MASQLKRKVSCILKLLCQFDSGICILCMVDINESIYCGLGCAMFSMHGSINSSMTSLTVNWLTDWRSSLMLSAGLWKYDN